MTISTPLELGLKRKAPRSWRCPSISPVTLFFISSCHVLSVGADANCAVVNYARLRRIVQQAHDCRWLCYLPEPLQYSTLSGTIYWDQPYQRRNPQASPARARTKETDTVRGVRPHDCLIKGALTFSLQKKEERREGDLLIFKYCAAETGEVRVVRPNVFACHGSIVFRRPNRARAGIFPPQVKALVKVPTILRVGVFTQ